jgi:hypothetical protein
MGRKIRQRKGEILIWESVAKWQSRATTTPPTLHIKPAVKFSAPKSPDKPEHRASSITSDTDDDDNPTYPPLHYRMTIDDDPEDEEPQNDDTQIDDTLLAAEVSDGIGDAAMETAASNPTPPLIHFVSTSAIAPTPEELAIIFTDVNRQLETPPSHAAPTPSDDDDITKDDAALARMDSHIRAILASADPMLYALNTALGHRVPRVSSPPHRRSDDRRDRGHVRVLPRRHQQQRRRIPLPTLATSRLTVGLHPVSNHT